MTTQVPHIPGFLESDVTGLLSHLGTFSKEAKYKEIVRDDTACQAIRRWPLLCEIHGFHTIESDLHPETANAS